MRHAPVEDNRCADAALHRSHAGLELGNHAAGHCPVSAQGVDLRRVKIGQQFTRFIEHAGNVSQQKQPRRTQCCRHCACHRVGIDVIGMPIRANTDRRDHGNHARTRNRVDHRAVNMLGLADKTQIDCAFDIAVGIARGPVDLFSADEIAVLARYADRAAAGFAYPAHELLVDRAGQHHFGDLRGFRIGHTQAIDERGLHSEFFQHGADLRTAAVNDDRIDADCFQQHDVLGKILRGFGVAHCMPTIFHDEGLPGIALHIRQCFDQHFGLGEE